MYLTILFHLLTHCLQLWLKMINQNLTLSPSISSCFSSIFSSPLRFLKSSLSSSKFLSFWALYSCWDPYPMTWVTRVLFIILSLSLNVDFIRGRAAGSFYIALVTLYKYVDMSLLRLRTYVDDDCVKYGPASLSENGWNASMSSLVTVLQGIDGHSKISY
jgi:hypothetical protein